MKLPTEAELRRGETLWGERPATPQTQIRRWYEFRNASGTQIGFIDARMPSGMVVLGCKLMVGPTGRHWVATPAQKVLDSNGNPKVDARGKAIWAPVGFDFDDARIRERFTEEILAALRRQYPEAFRDGSQ
jgi:hypothetical protein